MTALNQEAPPAPVSNNQDFVRFEKWPGDDSYVATCVAHNYIPEHTFDRTDKTTGRKFQEVKPAIELFFGAVIEGKPYFIKTYAQQYSINEKSNYYAWYSALVGKAPDSKQRPSDMKGKHALLEIELEDKVSKAGKAYTKTKIVSIGKVPKALAATAVPLAQLEAAFTAALAKSSEKADAKDDSANAPF